MDSLKKFSEEAKWKFNEAMEFSAKKIAESWNFSILKKEDLDELIEKSETTEFQNKETWEVKYFKHKSVLVIVDEKTDFYKKISLLFPVLKTKAFSENIKIMLSKTEVEGVDYKAQFEISEFPSLLVFENKEVSKIIIWEENIEKIAKSVKISLEEEFEKF